MEATKAVVVFQQEDVQLILVFQNAGARSFWAPALISWALVWDTNEFTFVRFRGEFFLVFFSFHCFLLFSFQRNSTSGSGTAISCRIPSAKNVKLLGEERLLNSLV